MLSKTLITLIAVLASAVPTPESGAADEVSRQRPLVLFEQRIMPIFKSPNPSSCVQCHLAAVDLKNYILPSHEKTFASLRDQGLIDLQQPRKSKILTLIQMGEKDLDEGARLIHAETRQAEYDALASWIEACCQDPAMLQLPRLRAAERARPEAPDSVIRHARKSRVVDSFVRLVWSQRMRCFPCHTPYELEGASSQHQGAVNKHKEFEEKYPELVERMKIFRETPEDTLQYLIDRSRETPEGQLPMINLEDPRKSLLVLKPMSKLPNKIAEDKFEAPSYSEPVSHMGGLKMHPNDHSYKSFVAWIQDYANVVGDRYTSVDQLPADNWYASKLVLKVIVAPSNWPVGTPVQLLVHASNGDSWDPQPVAFTQGTVTPRRMVIGALFLLAGRDVDTEKPDREKASLPRGNYLVKAYVDFKGRIANDPALVLGKEEFVGQAELKRARWREGFIHGEKVPGSAFKTLDFDSEALPTAAKPVTATID